MPKRKKHVVHQHHKVHKTHEEGFVSEDGQEKMNKNEKIVMGVLVLCILVFLGLSIIILFQKKNVKNAVPNNFSSSTTPTRVINTTPYPTIPPVKNMTVMLNTRIFNPPSFSIPKGGEVDFLNIDTEPITIEANDQNSSMLNLGSITSGDDKLVKFENSGTYTYRNKNQPTEVGIIIIK